MSADSAEVYISRPTMLIHAHTRQPVGQHGFEVVDTLHVYASPDRLRLLARFLVEAASDLESKPDFGHVHASDHFLNEWPDDAPEVIVLDPRGAR